MAPSIIPPATEKLLPRRPPVDFSAPSDPSTQQGTSLLITGGASGIGLQCARTIASQGALVTLADYQHEADQTTAREITSAGYKAQFVECNVTFYEAQCAAFKSAIDFGDGSIDVAILAAIMCQENLFDLAAKSKTFVDVSPPEPGLKTSLQSPSNFPPFERAIVFFGSVASHIGYPLDTTYAISKFGLRVLLIGIRGGDPEHRIRINLVAPWYIDMPLVFGEKAPLGVKEHAAMFKHVPIEAVAEAVIRLSAHEIVSGRSAFVSPLGAFDLGEDIWGGFGGAIMQEQLVAVVKSCMLTPEAEGTAGENA